MKRLAWILGALLIVVVAVLGVYNVQDSTAEDATENIGQTFEEVGEEAGEAGENIREGVEETGENVEEELNS